MRMQSQILSFARNKCFWALDLAGGGIIRKAVKEIKKIDALDSGAPFIKKHQNAAWKKLKQTACTTTEHYRDMLDRRFSEFPIITKNDIRSSQETFLSKKIDRDRMVQMSTSGSTGTPFVCYQNAEKKKRVSAELIYYSGKIGYRLGDNLSYVRTVVKQNRKSALKQFLQNQTLINCMSLGEQGIEEMLGRFREISKHETMTILGYGSTWTAIKDYVEKKNITYLDGIHPVGLISGAEMLFDDTRETVRRVFGGVPMVSRYSNEENGVIGQDEGINNVFPVNEADYIVEICDGNGNPLPEGKPGRIVITDLYNYGMPLIRYDTGDVGAIETIEINGRRKRCICQFSGRKVDVIYDTKGTALSPHSITNYMWSFPDIRQFQIVQTGKKEYKLRLNLPEEFNRKDELIAMLHKLVGGDAEFKLDIVEEIPVLASGKRRYIVNEWEGR